MIDLAALGQAWLLSLGGFLLLWLVSLVRRDASVVDFWWGPGFLAMAFAVWWQLGRPLDTMTLAIFLPLSCWAIRLGVHLGARRIHEGREDPRYRELREAWSPNWWIKSLFIVFVLQSVLQGLIGVGMLIGLSNAQFVPATWVAGLIAGVAVACIAIQTLSDLQLDRFRQDVPRRGLLTTGLRSYVRFPSYSAEIAFWACIAVLCTIAGTLWGWFSLAIIVLLLRYVSGIPVIDDRMMRTRPGYGAYRDAVPALIPRLLQGPYRTEASSSQ